MKSKTITSSKLSKKIQFPTSKSFAARALIHACLSDQNIEVSDIPNSLDTQELIKALEKLGLCKYDYERNKVNCFNVFPKDECLNSEINKVELGEGGTTIRFMLGLLSLGKNKYEIHVNPRFKNRPYLYQLDCLKALGVQIETSDKESVLCTIQGPISRDQGIDIDCSKTTQIATSFLLIKNSINLNVKLNHLNGSKSYIEMTKSINKLNEKLINVPVDMSSASYFIALATIMGPCIFPQIHSKDPLQADSVLLDYIEFEITNSGIKVLKQIIKPFSLDASCCIDLVPTLCFIASVNPGVFKLTGLDNLIYKETNRFEGIKSILEFFNVNFKSDSSSIEIMSSTIQTNSHSFTPLPDHRLVMMCSLFFKSLGFGEVGNADSVTKSFPSFFSCLEHEVDNFES